MDPVAQRRGFGEVGTLAPPADGPLSSPAPATLADFQPEPGTTRFAGRMAGLLAEEAAYRQGFLFVPVLLAAGAAAWFALPFSLPTVALAAALALVTPLFIRMRHGTEPAGLFVKAVFFIVAGMALADWETRRTDTTLLDGPVSTTVTGIVERRERDAGGNWRYRIALNATADPVLARPPATVTLSARGIHRPIAPGGVITGKARLSPPSGPALPGLNDFAFDAYFSGVGATGFFYGAPKAVAPDAYETASSSPLNAVDLWLYGLRARIAERIRSVIGGDAGAFAASIVTDERRAISPETIEALRVSGLAHIVAISGLNMSLASGIFFVGLRMAFGLFPAFSQRFAVKKLAAAAALVMTLGYYLISGFAVSAERAWLMTSIMLIAVILDRPALNLHNVALAALVILVLSPSAVTGPSFQMSFAATVALICVYGHWSRWRGGRERLEIARPPIWLTGVQTAGALIGGVIATSLIGGLSTAVYSIEHFQRTSSFGLAANLAAMPAMSLIVMPFGLIAMLAMPFGLDAPFLTVMGYGMGLVIDIAKYVAGWGGDIGTGRQSAWFLPTACAGFVLLCLPRTRLALAGLPLLLVALGLLAAERGKERADLLVYEDGALVALLGQGAVATTKARPAAFIYGQWRNALLLPEKPIAPEIIAARPMISDADKAVAREAMTTAAKTLAATPPALGSSMSGFACSRQGWCLGRSEKGPLVAVISETVLTGTACDLADIVISSRRAPFPACRSGAVLIDRESLRRSGSLEIVLADGAKKQAAIRAIAAAKAGRARPWDIHRGYDWRTRTYNAALPPHMARLLDAAD